MNDNDTRYRLNGRFVTRRDFLMSMAAGVAVAGVETARALRRRRADMAARPFSGKLYIPQQAAHDFSESGWQR